MNVLQHVLIDLQVTVGTWFCLSMRIGINNYFLVSLLYATVSVHLFEKSSLNPSRFKRFQGINKYLCMYIDTRLGVSNSRRR